MSSEQVGAPASSEKHREALRRLDEIIGRLTEPLSAQRRKNGWTEAARARNLEVFMGVREDLRAGLTPPDSAHLLRNADDWGVARGDILELIAQLTLLLDPEPRIR